MQLFSKTHTALSISDIEIVFISMRKETQYRISAYGRVELGSGVIVNGVLKKQKEFIQALRSLKIEESELLLVTNEYPNEVLLHILGEVDIKPVKIFHTKDCIDRLFKDELDTENVWTKFFSLHDYIPPITKEESVAYIPVLGAIVANM